MLLKSAELTSLSSALEVITVVLNEMCWFSSLHNQIIHVRQKNVHTHTHTHTHTDIYSISQKWAHPSHFCKYVIIYFHVTTLKKGHFSTM